MDHIQSFINRVVLTLTGPSEGTEKTLVILAVVGLCVVASALTSVWKGIYGRLLRPGKNLRKSFGSWGKSPI